MLTRVILVVTLLASLHHVTSMRVGNGAIIMDSNDPIYLNNTLLVMNPSTGGVTRLQSWSQSLAAIDYTYDWNTNTYFIETGLDTGTIWAFDAQTGKSLAQWDVGLSLTNIEFDATSQSIIGVQPDPIDGNYIVSLNLKTKNITVIAPVPDDWEVVQDSSAFDIQNRTYCTFGTDSMVREILLCVDISRATGNESDIWTAWVTATPSPMENYRPANGSGPLLLGYVNEEGIVGINIFTGASHPIISDSLLRGLPVIGGLCVDPTTNTLYVASGDAETDMAYLQVFALDSGRLINTFPLPDDVRFMAFFPNVSPPTIA